MSYSNIQTLISSIFVIVIYSTFVWLYINNSTTENKTIVYGMFILYLLGYIYLTFLSRKSGYGTLALNPFGILFDEIKKAKFPYETLLNILLFLPMGMTFPLMSKDISCKQVAVVAVIISLSTEIIQIITKHGWFETKDILTNVLGAILGFWIYSRILNK